MSQVPEEEFKPVTNEYIESLIKKYEDKNRLLRLEEEKLREQLKNKKTKKIEESRTNNESLAEDTSSEDSEKKLRRINNLIELQKMVINEQVLKKKIKKLEKKFALKLMLVEDFFKEKGFQPPAKIVTQSNVNENQNVMLESDQAKRPDENYLLGESQEKMISDIDFDKISQKESNTTKNSVKKSELSNAISRDRKSVSFTADSILIGTDGDSAPISSIKSNSEGSSRKTLNKKCTCRTINPVPCQCDEVNKDVPMVDNGTQTTMKECTLNTCRKHNHVTKGTSNPFFELPDVVSPIDSEVFSTPPEYIESHCEGANFCDKKSSGILLDELESKQIKKKCNCKKKGTNMKCVCKKLKEELRQQKALQSLGSENTNGKDRIASEGTGTLEFADKKSKKSDISEDTSRTKPYDEEKEIEVHDFLDQKHSFASAKTNGTASSKKSDSENDSKQKCGCKIGSMKCICNTMSIISQNVSQDLNDKISNDENINNTNNKIPEELSKSEQKICLCKKKSLKFNCICNELTKSQNIAYNITVDDKIDNVVSEIKELNVDKVVNIEDYIKEDNLSAKQQQHKCEELGSSAMCVCFQADVNVDYGVGIGVAEVEQSPTKIMNDELRVNTEEQRIDIDVKDEEGVNEKDEKEINIENSLDGDKEKEVDIETIVEKEIEVVNELENQEEVKVIEEIEKDLEFETKKETGEKVPEQLEETVDFNKTEIEKDEGKTKLKIVILVDSDLDLSNECVCITNRKDKRTIGPDKETESFKVLQEIQDLKEEETKLGDQVEDVKITEVLDEQPSEEKGDETLPKITDETADTEYIPDESTTDEISQRDIEVKKIEGIAQEIEVEKSTSDILVEPVIEVSDEPIEDMLVESVTEKPGELTDDIPVESDIEEIVVEPGVEEVLESIAEKLDEPTVDILIEPIVEKSDEPIEEIPEDASIAPTVEKPTELVVEKSSEPTEGTPVEPTVEVSTEELPVEPTEDASIEPTVEKTTELVVEKSSEPTEVTPVELTVEVSTEELIVEPIAETQTELTVEKPVEFTEEIPVVPLEEISDKPVEDTSAEPIVEVSTEPVIEKKDAPIEEIPVKPIEDIPVKLILDASIEFTVEKPSEPIEEIADESTGETQIDTLVEKPPQPIIEKSVEQTIEAPTELTVEKSPEPIEEKPLETIVDKPVEPETEEPVEYVAESVAEKQQETIVEPVTEPGSAVEKGSEPIVDKQEQVAQELSTEPVIESEFEKQEITEEITVEPISEIQTEPVSEKLPGPIDEVSTRLADELLTEPTDEILTKPEVEVIGEGMIEDKIQEEKVMEIVDKSVIHEIGKSIEAEERKDKKSIFELIIVIRSREDLVKDGQQTSVTDKIETTELIPISESKEVEEIIDTSRVVPEETEEVLESTEQKDIMNTGIIIEDSTDENKLINGSPDEEKIDIEIPPQHEEISDVGGIYQDTTNIVTKIIEDLPVEEKDEEITSKILKLEESVKEKEVLIIEALPKDKSSYKIEECIDVIGSEIYEGTGDSLYKIIGSITKCDCVDCSCLNCPSYPKNDGKKKIKKGAKSLSDIIGPTTKCDCIICNCINCPYNDNKYTLMESSKSEGYNPHIKNISAAESIIASTKSDALDAKCECAVCNCTRCGGVPTGSKEPEHLESRNTLKATDSVSHMVVFTEKCECINCLCEDCSKKGIVRPDNQKQDLYYDAKSNLKTGTVQLEVKKQSVHTDAECDCTTCMCENCPKKGLIQSEVRIQSVHTDAECDCTTCMCENCSKKGMVQSEGIVKLENQKQDMYSDAKSSSKTGMIQSEVNKQSIHTDAECDCTTCMCENCPKKGMVQSEGIVKLENQKQDMYSDAKSSSKTGMIQSEVNKQSIHTDAECDCTTCMCENCPKKGMLQSEGIIKPENQKQDMYSDAKSSSKTGMIQLEVNKQSIHTDAECDCTTCMCENCPKKGMVQSEGIVKPELQKQDMYSNAKSNSKTGMIQSEVNKQSIHTDAECDCTTCMCENCPKKGMVQSEGIIKPELQKQDMYSDAKSNSKTGMIQSEVNKQSIHTDAECDCTTCMCENCPKKGMLQSEGIIKPENQKQDMYSDAKSSSKTGMIQLEVNKQSIHTDAECDCTTCMCENCPKKGIEQSEGIVKPELQKQDMYSNAKSSSKTGMIQLEVNIQSMHTDAECDCATCICENCPKKGMVQSEGIIKPELQKQDMYSDAKSSSKTGMIQSEVNKQSMHTDAECDCTTCMCENCPKKGMVQSEVKIQSVHTDVECDCTTCMCENCPKKGMVQSEVRKQTEHTDAECECTTCLCENCSKKGMVKSEVQKQVILPDVICDCTICNCIGCTDPAHIIKSNVKLELNSKEPVEVITEPILNGNPDIGIPSAISAAENKIINICSSSGIIGENLPCGCIDCKCVNCNRLKYATVKCTQNTNCKSINCKCLKCQGKDERVKNMSVPDVVEENTNCKGINCKCLKCQGTYETDKNVIVPDVVEEKTKCKGQNCKCVLCQGEDETTTKTQKSVEFKINDEIKSDAVTYIAISTKPLFDLIVDIANCDCTDCKCPDCFHGNDVSTKKHFGVRVKTPVDYSKEEVKELAHNRSYADIEGDQNLEIVTCSSNGITDVNNISIENEEGNYQKYISVDSLVEIKDTVDKEIEEQLSIKQKKNINFCRSYPAIDAVSADILDLLSNDIVEVTEETINEGPNKITILKIVITGCSQQNDNEPSKNIEELFMNKDFMEISLSNSDEQNIASNKSQRASDTRLSESVCRAIRRCLLKSAASDGKYDPQDVSNIVQAIIAEKLSQDKSFDGFRSDLNESKEPTNELNRRISDAISTANKEVIKALSSANDNVNLAFEKANKIIENAILTAESQVAAQGTVQKVISFKSPDGDNGSSGTFTFKKPAHDNKCKCTKCECPSCPLLHEGQTESGQKLISAVSTDANLKSQGGSMVNKSLNFLEVNCDCTDNCTCLDCTGMKGSSKDKPSIKSQNVPMSTATMLHDANCKCDNCTILVTKTPPKQQIIKKSESTEGILMQSLMFNQHCRCVECDCDTCPYGETSDKKPSVPQVASKASEKRPSVTFKVEENNGIPKCKVADCSCFVCTCTLNAEQMLAMKKSGDLKSSAGPASVATMKSGPSDHSQGGASQGEYLGQFIILQKRASIQRAAMCALCTCGEVCGCTNCPHAFVKNTNREVRSSEKCNLCTCKNGCKCGDCPFSNNSGQGSAAPPVSTPTPTTNNDMCILCSCNGPCKCSDCPYSISRVPNVQIGEPTRKRSLTEVEDDMNYDEYCECANCRCSQCPLPAGRANKNKPSLDFDKLRACFCTECNVELSPYEINTHKHDSSQAKQAHVPHSPVKVGVFIFDFYHTPDCKCSQCHNSKRQRGGGSIENSKGKKQIKSEFPSKLSSPDIKLFNDFLIYKDNYRKNLYTSSEASKANRNSIENLETYCSSNSLSCALNSKEPSEGNIPFVETFDASLLKVIDLRQVSNKSLLVKWESPKTLDILGYEIYANGQKMHFVRNRERTIAVLFNVDLDQNIFVEVYAIGANGQFLPPATAIFLPY